MIIASILDRYDVGISAEASIFIPQKNIENGSWCEFLDLEIWERRLGYWGLPIIFDPPWLYARLYFLRVRTLTVFVETNLEGTLRRNQY